VRYGRYRFLLSLATVALVLVSLTPGVGTAQGVKLVMAFVPSMEAQKVLATGATLARMMELSTGYKIEATVPTSYAATIEALCAKRVDIAWLAPFSYVIAKAKCNADVRLITVRFNLPYYRSQIMVRADSGITKIEQLKGKRFAFTDPASTSGYLFPAAMLKKLGYDPDRFFSQKIFVGSHPNAVLAVYRGQVDGAASFEDARLAVARQFPDVLEKVKVIAYTDPIPNDTVSFGAHVPEEVKQKMTKALLRLSATPAGQEELKRLYEIQKLVDYETLVTTTWTQPDGKPLRIDRKKVPNLDAFFQPIRDVAKYLGIDLEEFIKPR
jgi:phosphonate transport system substrate-binding protein